MNEKQCVRCGRAGHDSAECKWLSAGSVNKQLLDALKMVLDDPEALDGRPRTYKCVIEAIAAAEQVQHVDKARSIIHKHGGWLRLADEEALQGATGVPEPKECGCHMLGDSNSGGFKCVGCGREFTIDQDGAYVPAAAPKQAEPHPYAGKRKGHPDGDFSYRCGSDYCRCSQ